jgi:L-ascorbate metabolism protein UlaG (beta-lactamase superfamily)/GT2 family glycosyltransferase
MQSKPRLLATTLGQSAIRLSADAVIYVDPYFSNSVEVLDSPDLVRRVSIPLSPNEVTDADFVLLTHEHIDHCDPHTLPLIAKASPRAKFLGPSAVLSILAGWGLSSDRLMEASESGIALSREIKAYAVPAAHPEIQRDESGRLWAVGYVIECGDQRVYVSGDTFARQEIIDQVKSHGPIDLAFLPVNEHNFFLGRRGILGNMSPREAFQLAREIRAKRVVPTHWDMFEVNSVDPEEILLVYRQFVDSFELLLNPGRLTLGLPKVSVIIRTLNEARYLDDLLCGVEDQLETDQLPYEVLLVDSGSTDGTVEIAQRHGCRILYIKREEFSFGRSLNLGCRAALGEILVMVSGHCVPLDKYWLKNLCTPLVSGIAQYSYGRQMGGPTSHFSEQRIFAKYFPAESKLPQEGFYCNNANSAVLRATWEHYRFNEELTGLEDMELAQRLVNDGGAVAYVAQACVHHHHNESWQQVRRRFEREAIALQKIMPQLQVSAFDTLRYFIASVIKDWTSAFSNPTANTAIGDVGPLAKRSGLVDILRYRFNQYWGAYRGNHELRKLSRVEKERYFYPQ